MVDFEYPCTHCGYPNKFTYAFKQTTQVRCVKCDKDYLVKYPETKSGDTIRRNGSPEFYAMLAEMADLHDKKSHDYASNDNPFGNYYWSGRLSVLFGASSKDAGFAGRLGEKLYRIANLESGGKIPLNEDIAETERDICVIVMLWMAARREERKKRPAAVFTTPATVMGGVKEVTTVSLDAASESARRLVEKERMKYSSHAPAQLNMYKVQEALKKFEDSKMLLTSSEINVLAEEIAFRHGYTEAMESLNRIKSE